MSQAQAAPPVSSLNLSDPDAFPRKRLIYIAMPYSAPTKQGIADNIEAARSFVRDYIPRDPHILPVLPHNLGLGIECIGDDQYWYDATASVLLQCDAMIAGPGWERSEGCKQEVRHAEKYHIECLRWFDAVPGTSLPMKARVRYFIKHIRNQPPRLT
jgi:hypothetical protein